MGWILTVNKKQTFFIVSVLFSLCFIIACKPDGEEAGLVEPETEISPILERLIFAFENDSIDIQDSIFDVWYDSLPSYTQEEINSFDDTTKTVYKIYNT